MRAVTMKTSHMLCTSITSLSTSISSGSRYEDDDYEYIGGKSDTGWNTGTPD